MGYTAAESHVHADELGDTFSEDMVDRIDERLGRPERCPHGWPVDPGVEQTENRDLVSLAELGAGRAAGIVRLAAHDGDPLPWVFHEGPLPRTRVEGGGAPPAGGGRKKAGGGGR